MKIISFQNCDVYSNIFRFAISASVRYEAAEKWKKKYLKPNQYHQNVLLCHKWIVNKNPMCLQNLRLVYYVIYFQAACKMPFLITFWGRSQTTLTRFGLFFTTYPPALTVCMVWTLTKSGHFKTTYLPRLVNVVCERPLTQKSLTRFLLPRFLGPRKNCTKGSFTNYVYKTK